MRASVRTCKGRLKNCVKFWESIGVNKAIHDVLLEGYRIPFYSTPTNNDFENIKSAKNIVDFVTQEVMELWKSGRIKEVSSKPHVVNPLSVSERGGGEEKINFRLDTCELVPL